MNMYFLLHTQHSSFTSCFFYPCRDVYTQPSPPGYQINPATVGRDTSRVSVDMYGVSVFTCCESSKYTKAVQQDLVYATPLSNRMRTYTAEWQLDRSLFDFVHFFSQGRSQEKWHGTNSEQNLSYKIKFYVTNMCV